MPNRHEISEEEQTDAVFGTIIPYRMTEEQKNRLWTKINVAGHKFWVFRTIREVMAERIASNDQREIDEVTAAISLDSLRYNNPCTPIPEETRMRLKAVREKYVSQRTQIWAVVLMKEPKVTVHIDGKEAIVPEDTYLKALDEFSPSTGETRAHSVDELAAAFIGVGARGTTFDLLNPCLKLDEKVVKRLSSCLGCS